MLFPVEDAEAHFRSGGLEVQAYRDGLQWRHFDGTTSLVVKEIHHSTDDGRTVDEVVTLRHTSPALASLPHEASGMLNRWATQSALVESLTDGRLELASKVGVFSTDKEAAEWIYAPLVCMEAMTVGWHAACLARQIWETDPENSPLSDTDVPPPFSEADFAFAKEFTDHGGHLGTLGEQGLTVEFAWDPGAVSNLFLYGDVRERMLQEGGCTEADLDRLGGRTSLLQVKTSERHALYGNGVFCSLEIPLSIAEPKASRLVTLLNQWELMSPELPPLFGAWCVGPRAPAFVTFIPNQCCIPRLLRYLTVWAEARHQRLVELFSTPSATH